VRTFLVWFADEKGFYFITLAGKSVCKQLRVNPRVEVCFFNNKQGDEARMMRVTGEIEFLEDIDIRRKAMESRPLLKKYAAGPEDKAFEVFCLHTGEAFFWTFKDILKEAQLERVHF